MIGTTITPGRRHPPPTGAPLIGRTTNQFTANTSVTANSAQPQRPVQETGQSGDHEGAEHAPIDRPRRPARRWPARPRAGPAACCRDWAGRSRVQRPSRTPTDGTPARSARRPRSPLPPCARNCPSRHFTPEAADRATDAPLRAGQPATTKWLRRRSGRRNAGRSAGRRPPTRAAPTWRARRRHCRRR